jgi:hypothetical protein
MMHQNVPAISAECAHCGCIFALNLTLDCPRCHKTGVTWATLTENVPCDPPDPGAQAELDWLEANIR